LFNNPHPASIALLPNTCFIPLCTKVWLISFAIFAGMNKIKKTLSLSILLISFTLLQADLSFFSFSESNAIIACDDFPDFSNHFEHSHAHGSEDNLIVNELKSKSDHLIFRVEIISTPDKNFKSNFISNIWQPPKVS
jgi:hypothetical protein